MLWDFQIASDALEQAGDTSTPGANPGTVTEFPANRPGNSRLSRVCGESARELMEDTYAAEAAAECDWRRYARLGSAAGWIGGVEIRFAGSAAGSAVHADHVRFRGGHDARDFAGWQVGGVRFRPRRRPQPGPLCAAASGRRPGTADVDPGERIGSVVLQRRHRYCVPLEQGWRRHLSDPVAGRHSAIAGARGPQSALLSAREPGGLLDGYAGWAGGWRREDVRGFHSGRRATRDSTRFFLCAAGSEEHTAE